MMSAVRALQTLLQVLRSEVPGLLHDRIELFSLEARRAGQAAVQMLVFVLTAALCGVTAWAAFWFGVVALLLALDVHWAVAIGAVLLVNAAVALWALSRVRGLLPLLDLPATRRHLRLGAPMGAGIPQHRDEPR